MIQIVETFLSREIHSIRNRKLWQHYLLSATWDSIGNVSSSRCGTGGQRENINVPLGCPKNGHVEEIKRTTPQMIDYDVRNTSPIDENIPKNSFSMPVLGFMKKVMGYDQFSKK